MPNGNYLVHQGRASSMESMVGMTNGKKVARVSILKGVVGREAGTRVKEGKMEVIENMRKGERAKGRTKVVIEIKGEGKKVINLVKCCQRVLGRVN